MLERANANQGMTLPELSVLISYAKSVLKGDLIASDVPDDPYIQQHLERVFPSVLVERFYDEMYEHRLKREIVATQIANDLVDHMGVVFVRRLIDTTGASRAEIARAYIVARDSFNLDALWQQVEALDNQVPSQVQYRMMLDLMRLTAPCHPLVPASAYRHDRQGLHRPLRAATDPAAGEHRQAPAG